MSRLTRVEDEAAGTQIRERVGGADSRQASDATSTHGHDDLSARTDVVKVAAQLIVQFAHTYLSVRFLAM
ncbi:MAG: hypothetical protein WA880_10825 [Ornithinimicrobium sp.]